MKIQGVFGWVLLLIAASVNVSAYDWVHRFPPEVVVASIATDAEENLYVAGTFTGTNVIDGHQLASRGGTDVFIACIDIDGALRWITSAGGINDDSMIGLGVSTNGTLFVCGNFSIAPSGPKAKLAIL